MSEKNRKPIDKLTKQLSNQRGFALIFTILILVGMLAASLVISSIILRVAHSVGKITDSEIAYYAAETAAEKVLYEINKNYVDISSFTLPIGTIDLGAEYSQIFISQEKVNFFNKENISPGKSLQLDMDLNLFNSDYPYPSNLTISGSGKLIILKINKTNLQPEEQIIQDFSENISISDTSLSSLDFDNYYYKLRLFNDTENEVDYTITPSSGTLTIGTIITTKGSYRGTERILETKNPKWQIY